MGSILYIVHLFEEKDGYFRNLCHDLPKIYSYTVLVRSCKNLAKNHDNILVR